MREIDALLDEGRRPIVVGGTGLYLRAALADLELRPPVPAEVRAEVEAELAERGPRRCTRELDPRRGGGASIPTTASGSSRLTELQRLGIDPHTSSEGLWTRARARPTRLVGLTIEREELARAHRRARVDAMVAAGAEDEVRAADAAGASRTARAAHRLRGAASRATSSA